MIGTEGFKVRQNERGQWQVEMPAGDSSQVCESKEQAELISEALQLFYQREPSQGAVRRVLDALGRRGWNVRDPLYRKVMSKVKNEDSW
jgi:hypothetical protein